MCKRIICYESNVLHSGVDGSFTCTFTFGMFMIISYANSPTVLAIIFIKLSPDQLHCLCV